MIIIDCTEAVASAGAIVIAAMDAYTTDTMGSDLDFAYRYLQREIAYAKCSL